MPLRVAEKDGFLWAVNKCGDCPFHSMMLTGTKDHLAGGESPSGLGCFHDEIVEIDKSILTLKETKKGRGIKPVCIPVWCPLPVGEYREFQVLPPEHKLDIHSNDHRKKLPNP